MSADATPAEAGAPLPRLIARRLGLNTQHEAVVLMRADCAVCKAEGLAPRAQVLLSAGGREVIATLYQVAGDILQPSEAGLSEAAWTLLGVNEREPIEVRHPAPLDSFAGVRRRIYGARLDAAALRAIIADVVAGRYADVQLSAFLTACSALPLDLSETTALTGAMTETGERLSWSAKLVADKHSVGGLPGNRTTPIIVAIVAANGLTIPKTSSRAITSPAGTADMMETLAPVDLDLAAMRRVVEREGGCIAWGGAMRLAPADDILIRVERTLDMDAQGQMVASMLSKKLAAGATHVVFDLPVGPTAKLRTDDSANDMSLHLEAVAAHFGLKSRCVLTDGAQPVGRGVGPALEARDVLAVLQGSPEGPDDLRRRAVMLAGAVLELAGAAAPGKGEAMAAVTLVSGRAWAKFQAICEAQGGMRTPPVSPLRRDLPAARSGRLTHNNKRKVARLAKLAGAPDDPAAGLDLHVRLGDEVAAGQPLLTLHADAPGELAYALEYAAANPDIFAMES